jgi:DNA ligase-1
MGPYLFNQHTIMTLIKPSLAEDAILDAVKFPCWVQPKIDGVRALNTSGRLTGRSLDEFKGFGITDYFSQSEFIGLDGEMILGSVPNDTNRLCSATTGAMGRFKGVTEMADVHWYVFDYLSDLSLSYAARYSLLSKVVSDLNHSRIHMVPNQECFNLDDLKWWIAHWASQGYEGTIIRNPEAPYKAGRATLKGQELWRVKPWADAEILVTGITEGNENHNTKKTNSLGRSERGASKAGMLPNGQVGSIQGILLADFIDPISGQKLFSKGLETTVSSGAMSVQEATYYFQNPALIVGHLVKFQHMTHGVKDQPRFPGYVSHRLKEDMS